jgi:hypothetical protein
MSKSKSEAPAQLSLINFDDIESIETEPVTETAPVQPIVETETEEQVLATVQSFDSAFVNDPLKDKYLAFGETARALVDPIDVVPRFVALGAMCHNLMVDEKNLAPGAYERPKVIAKCETALRLCNVPEYLVRPNEIVAVFWVSKLDRSTAPAEGESRTYPVDEAPAEWFGGNLTMTALRIIAKCISRASKADETDVYDFKEGFEPHVREWVKRLREGYLSCRQVETLIEYRRKRMTDERKAQKYAGLSEQDRASIEAAEKNASLQSKLTELGSKALELQKMAAEDLKKGKEELRDFLANKGVIPPAAFPTPLEIAARLTPGDAKALVQALVKLYPTQPDRLNVFKVLWHTAKNVVNEINATREKQTAKAG